MQHMWRQTTASTILLAAEENKRIFSQKVSYDSHDSEFHHTSLKTNPKVRPKVSLSPSSKMITPLLSDTRN